MPVGKYGECFVLKSLLANSGILEGAGHPIGGFSGLAHIVGNAPKVRHQSSLVAYLGSDCNGAKTGHGFAEL